MSCLPVFSAALDIRSKILQTEQIALFLDFDGTLAPIQPRPSDARLDPAVRESLQSLARRDDLILSIVSGREIETLQELIDIPDLIYAGNHGLQIVGRHISFLEPVAAARRELIQEIASDLSHRLRRTPGAEVEFKRLSVAIHYRRASNAEVDEIREEVMRAAESAAPMVQLKAGKMVWEILPRNGWNKGNATSWIYDKLARPRALLIYIGDDHTDEDVFRRFRDAVTIRVGEHDKTAANFYLDGPREVHQFLNWLDHSRK